MDKMIEAISLESDLLLKLNPLSEAEIFEFMKNLRGGTYFNMGMYSSIPVARAYKSSIRIYKVLDLTAIVSGVSYENIGTTKEFRQSTGETPGHAWYDHTPGYENKVGQKKSDPNSKYVLWDIKRGTGTCVRYYVVDIDTGAVTPVSKDDIMQSAYLTQTEKNKLTPRPVVGIDLTTGQAVENKTVWRTAAFDHIFWLNQSGKSTQEYGVRFEEDLNLEEAFGDEIFMDAHAHVRTDLDTILSGEVVESVEKPLGEAVDLFMDAHAGVETRLDDILSGKMTESKKLNESAEPALYETAAARAMHFMFVNCEMDYQEIADELGINVQVVLDLIGPDSYDDKDIMLEAADKIKGVRTVTIHSDTDEKVVLDFKTFKEAAEHFEDLYQNAVEENYAEEVLYPIMVAAQTEEYDYIDDEGYAVIEADATGVFDNALDGIWDDEDSEIEENYQANTSTDSLKESYRRIVSRGQSLTDNELFVDFD